jgi:hypothetical protein
MRTVQMVPGATAIEQATAPVTGTSAANPYQSPNPWQINPAVWDSMSGTAKQMILSSAEQGNTPAGAWNATDFLSQLEAARPQGTAPRRVSTNWGSQSLY